MRQILSPQLQLGETAIEDILFNLESRDDIPQILRGLQYIYTTPEIQEEVFKLLEEIVPEKDKATEGDSQKVDTTQGRPGMNLWTIFVLGCLRLNINCDYDRLMELANEHNKLRQILGHGLVDEDYVYCLQTIKDNVSLLTPEVLDKINQIVVKSGHALLGAEDSPLNAHCDSVVVETDVRYPTDIHQLLDAMRVIIRICGRVAKDLGLTGWRQYEHNYQCLKKLYRIAQKMKHSTSKDEAKVEARKAQIEKAYQAYLNLANSLLARAKETLNELRSIAFFDKGYYTPENREQLQDILNKVVMSKKGRRSKNDQEIETEEEFVNARKRHAAVESAINALEVHGLDRCRDHGIDGFKRYIALAVVARNIQKVGSIILHREKKAAQCEERKRKQAA